MEITPDTILWHYTNGAAFLAIVDSMSIFSSHISCLNDASELRYATKLLREALTALRQTVGAGETALSFINGALNYFQENPEFPAQAVTPYFVTCFSEEKDDLSQWRAYAGGENGYAVGFRARDLLGCDNSILGRINYNVKSTSNISPQSGGGNRSVLSRRGEEICSSQPRQVGRRILGGLGTIHHDGCDINQRCKLRQRA